MRHYSWPAFQLRAPNSPEWLPRRSRNCNGGQRRHPFGSRAKWLDSPGPQTYPLPPSADLLPPLE